MRPVLLAVWFGALASGVPASAHHSFAAVYFEQQQISIEGDVLQFDFVNPHAWVHVMATDENGVLQKFSAEWSSPGRLKQAGLTPESIKPGDHVIITGSPGRDAADHRIHLKVIERPQDGWKWPSRRASR